MKNNLPMEVKSTVKEPIKRTTRKIKSWFKPSSNFSILLSHTCFSRLILRLLRHLHTQFHPNPILFRIALNV
jgi:hypothetical protein